ncbi:hypothetical protein Q8W71_22245 [Methylobacterium sp. NEAU 140]|nr:hypothetical protein [Methylobacterium sp. NEAU 140]MDP4025356.1 hypothetical protein [Methylobacterium sp. NEAU 140]
MTDAYALQIAGISAVLSILGLGSLLVAARIYDRNTRRLEAAARDRR